MFFGGSERVHGAVYGAGFAGRMGSVGFVVLRDKEKLELHGWSSRLFWLRTSHNDMGMSKNSTP